MKAKHLGRTKPGKPPRTAKVGLAFGWYVRNIADYNLLYGSIGAAIALMVWLYVLAAVALVGCEFNAELERLSHALGRG